MQVQVLPGESRETPATTRWSAAPYQHPSSACFPTPLTMPNFFETIPVVSVLPPYSAGVRWTVGEWEEERRGVWSFDSARKPYPSFQPRAQHSRLLSLSPYSATITVAHFVLASAPHRHVEISRRFDLARDRHGHLPPGLGGARQDLWCVPASPKHKKLSLGTG